MRITKTIIPLVLVLGLLTCIPAQPTTAQFILAYTYPDNNGTGYSVVGLYLDDVLHTLYSKNDDPDGPLNNGSILIETEVTNVTLLVQCWLNGTEYDIASLAEGLNIIRVNVTVTQNNGTVVFSKQNLTNFVNTDGSAPMYWYSFADELAFTLELGAVYTIETIMEVYYVGG